MLNRKLLLNGALLTSIHVVTSATGIYKLLVDYDKDIIKVLTGYHGAGGIRHGIGDIQHHPKLKVADIAVVTVSI